MAVHVYGKPRVVTDAGEMHALMKGLVDRYEGPSEGDAEGPTIPGRYTLEGLPPDFLAGQMKGIVGFEIVVDEIQASFKLSQNRDEKNHESVMAELRKSDDQKAHRVADAMDKRRRTKS
jgi:transcriptional regulator